MRRQLRRFYPVLLIALTVQILAPVAACWAATIAADPLQAAVICHDNAASTAGPTDETGQPRRPQLRHPTAMPSAWSGSAAPPICLVLEPALTLRRARLRS